MMTRAQSCPILGSESLNSSNLAENQPKEAKKKKEEATLYERCMDKFHSVSKTLKTVASVVKTVNSIIKMFKAMDLVAKPILEVLPFAAIGAYVIGVLPSSIYQTVQSGYRAHSFSNLSAQLRACDEDMTLQGHLLQCNLQDIKVDDLEDDLYLSSEASKNLQERIDRVMHLNLGVSEGLSTEDQGAIQEMVAALNVLKTRSRVVLAYDNMDFLTNIVELASEALFLTPLNTVAASLGLTSIASEILLPFGKDYCLSPNPFDPDSKSKVLELADTIKTKAKQAIGWLDPRQWGHRSVTLVVPEDWDTCSGVSS